MRRIISIGMTLILAAAFLCPLMVRAESVGKVVRVGWHEEPYFIRDAYGRRSGYSYEYQWKVAAYTGWTYEYVEGTWSELFEMLKRGEIDLMRRLLYGRTNEGHAVCVFADGNGSLLCVCLSRQYVDYVR